MVNIPITRITPAALFQKPIEGNKYISYLIDFSITPLAEFDLQLQFTGGQFTQFQTMFVDNNLATGNVQYTDLTTGQKIIIPKSSQGYYNLLQGISPPKFSLAPLVGTPIICVSLLNFFIPGNIWLIP